MKIKDNLLKYFLLAFFVGAVGVVVAKVTAPSSGGTRVDVSVPAFTSIAQAGEKAFTANCVQCHGVNAAGTDKGPPLVHDIYNPGHHGDDAFFFAVRNGTRQHHWPYGNMPAQPQVSMSELGAIVQYVRELQAANGIAFRAHQM